MFHDQSTHIVKKITGSTVFVLEKPAPKQQTAPKITNCVMYPSLEQLGVNFFMSDLVAGDPNLSQLYYIPSYYAKTGYAHPGLHYSITATGLASYARATGRREFVEHATKSYINAVRGINAALSNPKTAAHDSTLLCINLAAMFEVLAAPQKEGQNNCMKHMEGAVTVALLHVKQGRQTDVTQKILSTMIQGFIVYAWLNNTPLPSAFTELQGYTNPSFYGSPIQYGCLTCMKDTVDFRHALQTGSYESPMSIIRKGIDLDSSWDKFMANMPPEVRFEVFRTSKDGVAHLVYEGYFHRKHFLFYVHSIFKKMKYPTSPSRLSKRILNTHVERRTNSFNPHQSRNSPTMPPSAFCPSRLRSRLRTNPARSIRGQSHCLHYRNGSHSTSIRRLHGAASRRRRQPNGQRLATTRRDALARKDQLTRKLQRAGSSHKHHYRIHGLGTT